MSPSRRDKALVKKAGGVGERVDAAFISFKKEQGRRNMEGNDMAKVIGIGGVFFRSGDPERLYAWYEKHLGLHRAPGGVVLFPWRQAGEEAGDRLTVWSLFPKDTDYFGPANPAFMVNYIVDDLDGLVADLRAAGAAVEDRREDSAYGRFAWVTDPEGNRVELWQPPDRPPP